MAKYIEREKLTKHCESMIDKTWNSKMVPVSWAHAYADFLDDIMNIPAADVAPVVHGKWIGKPISGFATVGCSVCRKTFSENNGRWKFCPNCGCKMDGGDESAVD